MRTWTEEVGKANHALLLRLAEADKELSEDVLCDGLNKRAALDAFYALRERSIISSPDNSGYYRITFGLFKNWIKPNTMYYFCFHKLLKTIPLVLMLAWWPVCYVERSRGYVDDDGRDTLALFDEGPIGIVVEANTVWGGGVIREHGA